MPISALNYLYILGPKQDKYRLKSDCCISKFFFWFKCVLTKQVKLGLSFGHKRSNKIILTFVSYIVQIGNVSNLLNYPIESIQNLRRLKPTKLYYNYSNLIQIKALQVYLGARLFYLATCKRSLKAKEKGLRNARLGSNFSKWIKIIIFWLQIIEQLQCALAYI